MLGRIEGGCTLLINLSYKTQLTLLIKLVFHFLVFFDLFTGTFLFFYLSFDLTETDDFKVTFCFLDGRSSALDADLLEERTYLVISLANLFFPARDLALFAVSFMEIVLKPRVTFFSALTFISGIGVSRFESLTDFFETVGSL